MPPLLSIETATSVCSVAIHDNNTLIAHTEFHLQKVHAAALTSTIDFLLKQCGILHQDLTAVAVSKGPGSYTGLRIGVATAKALSFTLDIPLISVNTLEAMALAAVPFASDDSFRICTMLDARRMEVYYALFDYAGKLLAPVTAEIITGDLLSGILRENPVLFCGDGAEKCRKFFKLFKNAYVLDSVYPSAKWVGTIAGEKLHAQQFEDVVSFEPFYLKEFVKPTK